MTDESVVVGHSTEEKSNEALDNEPSYRDNIPEQFEQRIETANHACEQLEEEIACLEDAL